MEKYCRILEVLTPVSDRAFVWLLVEKCWDATQEDMKERDKVEGKRGMHAQGKYTNSGGTSMKNRRMVLQRDSNFY
jgi:hypothetical protein